MKKRRIIAVDVMRGGAMVLVIMAHSMSFLSHGERIPFVYLLLGQTTRIASVAFMFLSGTIVSYFYFLYSNKGRIYRRFALRACLLLILVHPAIMLASYLFYDNPGGMISYMTHAYPITDTIGLSLLIAPVFICFLRRQARLIVTCCFLAVAPLVVAFYHPSPGYMTHIIAAVFGSGSGTPYPIQVNWPLLPWLAVFLAGSFVGQPLAETFEGKRSISRLTADMKLAAMGLVVLGLILLSGKKMLEMTYAEVWDPRPFETIFSGRTGASLPIYIAILIFLMATLIVRVDGAGRFGRLAWGLSVFGRTSLFTFVVQFAVIMSAPALVGIKGKLVFWQYIIFLMTGLMICWILAYIYGRIRGWLAVDDLGRIRQLLQRPIGT